MLIGQQTSFGHLPCVGSIAQVEELHRQNTELHGHLSSWEEKAELGNYLFRPQLGLWQVGSAVLTWWSDSMKST